jgi:hypothetical protein
MVALKAAVSVTPLRRLPLTTSPSSLSAARRLARVSPAMASATAVQPVVVVGGGRVGRALLAMGPPGADVLVGRGEKVPDDAPGPILVCTRNDDLNTVLENTPKSRWRGTCPVPPQFLSQLVFHCARYGRCQGDCVCFELGAIGSASEFAWHVRSCLFPTASL